MLRVIAVDDEPLALGQLEKYIAKVPFLSLVAACPSALEARKVLEEKEVDAMFLDINMPDFSGMDFVRSLRHPPLTVFTTAYSEFAVEGFKVDAVDYLLKPYTLSEFIASAEKLRARFELLQAAESGGAAASGSVFFKADYKTIRVEISDIVYVEGMSEYLKIYLTDEQMPKVVLMSFSKLLEKLPASRFVRVHRSYVINLDKVAEVSSGTILMTTGKTIPIGDSYRSALMNLL
ncbi:MAG: LytTR family DNA-binding domain-containing protein [Bacteroidia bacterium]|nr:LytTR family DNA-binding domain-containing protein [Bacteroidia bacterium]